MISRNVFICYTVPSKLQENGRVGICQNDIRLHLHLPWDENWFEHFEQQPEGPLVRALFGKQSPPPFKWVKNGFVSMSRNGSQVASKVRQRPPAFIKHALTFLVFWSWVLLLFQLPPWSQSPRLFPLVLAFCFMGPSTSAWICCLQLPYHPCKNRTHSTCFYSTGGHTPKK